MGHPRVRRLGLEAVRGKWRHRCCQKRKSRDSEQRCGRISSRGCVRHGWNADCCAQLVNSYQELLTYVVEWVIVCDFHADLFGLENSRPATSGVLEITMSAG